MNFTSEKIKILNSLLMKYQFTDGFTNYFQKEKVSNKKVSSSIDIPVYGSDPTAKNPLSDHENLAIFPIVFDYYDAVIDKEYSLYGENFRTKISKIKGLHRDDAVSELIENTVYENIIELRNKIIHNNAKVSFDDDRIILPSHTEYKISEIGNLNRLAFNVAEKILQKKRLILYEKSAAASLMKNVFTNFNWEALSEVNKKDELIEMTVYPRIFRDYSEEKLPNNKSLYDLLSDSKKCLPRNITLNLHFDDKSIIIPAELLNAKKHLTLNDIRGWAA